MMKKSSGPAFRAAQIDLTKCLACRGRAVISGVFHELVCVQCNASGWLLSKLIDTRLQPPQTLCRWTVRR